MEVTKKAMIRVFELKDKDSKYFIEETVEENQNSAEWRVFRYNFLYHRWDGITGTDEGHSILEYFKVNHFHSLENRWR